jgi:hypothetical protein
MTLEEISHRLTVAGVEHLATFQHLMTNRPIVVWERDMKTGEIFLQYTNPSNDSPDVQRVIDIGHGRIHRS